MKKIIILLLLSIGSMFAQVTYIAKASLLGEIGRVTISEKKDKQHYQIDVKIKATGIAKSMSGNLVEHHISKGLIKKGEYYAQEYRIEKSSSGKRYLKRYLFDYKQKKITKISKKWKKGKLLYSHKRSLKYFSQNDLLTIYHNIMLFGVGGKTGQYTIKSAGAEQGDKKLLFHLLDTRQRSKILKDAGLSEEGSVLKVFMRRGFFSDGKGSLAFLVDQEGVTQKAILKNVKLLGTVTAKRVK
jgi:hypothetical protein